MLMDRSRLILAVAVLLTGLGTLFALLYVGRGEAISHANQMAALKQLSRIFLPLFALILGYVFGGTPPDTAHRGARTAIAVLVVTVWCLTPAAVFGFTRTIEDSMDLLAILEPWSESVVMVVLGFYFGKH